MGRPNDGGYGQQQPPQRKDYGAGYDGYYRYDQTGPYAEGPPGDLSSQPPASPSTASAVLNAPWLKALGAAVITALISLNTYLSSDASSNLDDTREEIGHRVSQVSDSCQDAADTAHDSADDNDAFQTDVKKRISTIKKKIEAVDDQVGNAPAPRLRQVSPRPGKRRSSSSPSPRAT